MGEDVESILRVADAGLLTAKDEGRDRVVLADGDLASRVFGPRAPSPPPDVDGPVGEDPAGHQPTSEQPIVAGSLFSAGAGEDLSPGVSEPAGLWAPPPTRPHVGSTDA
jgi:hypothetical protein